MVLSTELRAIFQSLVTHIVILCDLGDLFELRISTLCFAAFYPAIFQLCFNCTF